MGTFFIVNVNKLYGFQKFKKKAKTIKLIDKKMQNIHQINENYNNVSYIK